MSIKKALTVIVSLLMLVSGVFLAYTYSSPVQAQNTVAKGSVYVPAGSHQSIIYSENQAGIYYFQIDPDNGTVQVYINDENSTVNYWQNGTECPKTPDFNGSSGQFGWNIIGGTFPNTRYLVFSNPDSYNKNITYEVSCHYTYNNNFGLMAGIAFTAVGAIAFFLTLLKDKLWDFNKALDNQE